MKNKNASLRFFLKEYFSSSVMALCVGIGLSILVLVVFSGRSFSSASDFFVGVFTSSFYMGSLLNTASLLMWASVGASFAMASGNLNLGGEGQIYLAGFLSALILGMTDILPGFFRVILAFLVAIISGALCAFIPALLKRYRGSSELLTSFLFSAATIPLVDAAIVGSFRDSRGNLMATPSVPEWLRLKSIWPPSAMNSSFFVAIVFCVTCAFVLYKTVFGKKLCICGKSPLFARYAGFSVENASLIGMCFSGAFHGLTGFFAIWGTYYTCHSGFYNGMGWNALSCALIARSNPLAVMPASLLLAWIFTAADRAAMVNGFAFDMESLIQGAILFFISANFFGKELFFLKKRKLR